MIEYAIFLRVTCQCQEDIADHFWEYNHIVPCFFISFAKMMFLFCSVYWWNLKICLKATKIKVQNCTLILVAFMVSLGDINCTMLIAKFQYSKLTILIHQVGLPNENEMWFDDYSHSPPIILHF